MDKIRQELKEEAQRLHGEIYPSGSSKSLDDCFTIQNNEILFWFNVDETTRMLRKEIPS